MIKPLTIAMLAAAARGDVWFSVIETPKAATSAAIGGMSADGRVVVGTWYSGSSGQPFRWTRELGRQDLPISGVAVGVSADGSVVAVVSGGGAGVWSEAAGFVPIAGAGSASSMSAGGEFLVGSSSIIGPYRWSSGAGLLGLSSGGTFTPTGVSDSGTVISAKLGNRAGVWTPATGMQDIGVLPFGDSSEALGVSADGSTVVGQSTVFAYPRAFHWTAGGGMQPLAGTTNSLSTARRVSANGLFAAGTRQATTGRPSAVLWRGSSNLYGIGTLLSNGGAGPPSGWALSDVYGLSADGLSFAGTGLRDNLVQFIWAGSVAPTPCYPDCDKAFYEVSLNVLDFTCFLNAYASGSDYANCDRSTVAPVLNVADFACFLNAFASGCS